MTRQRIEPSTISDDISHDLLNQIEVARSSINEYMNEFEMPGSVYRNFRAAAAELSKATFSMSAADAAARAIASSES